MKTKIVLAVLLAISAGYNAMQHFKARERERDNAGLWVSGLQTQLAVLDTLQGYVSVACRNSAPVDKALEQYKKSNQEALAIMHAIAGK